jgi:hypothetical protein
VPQELQVTIRCRKMMDGSSVAGLRERGPTESACLRGFISGPIERGDYEKVRTLSRENHPFLAAFTLASPGGDVAEAIKIGRLFRKYLIAALAPIHIRFPEGGEMFHASAQARARSSGLVQSIVGALSGCTGHEPMIHPSRR